MTNGNTDDFSDLTPNQKRALSKGLAALETMAALWESEIRLAKMSKHIAEISDPVERAKRVQAMLELAFIEGAYRHYLDQPSVETDAESEAVYQRLTDMGWAETTWEGYASWEGVKRILYTTPQAECAHKFVPYYEGVQLCEKCKVTQAECAPRADEKRCTYCDGTGSVHRIDGEYLGECPDCNPRADADTAGAKPLTDAEIEAGWRHTFSTDNPYCPCNLKSFTKAVRWAERAKDSK